MTAFESPMHKPKKALPLQRKVATLGAISWTIIVPTLTGGALGLWVDTLWPSSYSWFSLFLPVGLLIGCLVAMLWEQSESI